MLIEGVQGIYKQKKYRRSLWLLTSGFLGFIIYALPSFIKILLFLIPIIVFCYALSGTRNRFNFILFILILFIIMLFSSVLTTNILYLAADVAPPTIDYPALDINVDFNTITIYNAIDTVAGPVLFFMIGFIPVLAIAGAIYAIIIGQINQALTAIVRVVCMFTVLVIFIVIFDSFGYSIPFVTDAIKNVAAWYLKTMQSVYDWIQCLADPTKCAPSAPNTIGGITVTKGITGGTAVPGCEGDPNYIPAADMDGNGCLDWWEQFVWNYSHAPTYNALKIVDPAFFQIGLASGIPMIISGLNIVFGLLFLSKKFRARNDAFFDRYTLKEPEPERQLIHFNYRLAVFVGIIIACAFMMFLNFARIYKETGIINFSEVGYVGIYVTMISIPVVFLSFPSVTIYTQSGWKNTVIGTIFGLGILFLSFNFLYGTTKTLDAYNLEYSGYAAQQVLNTFIFVAPAESMFFHVFLPSLFLGWLYQRGTKNADNTTKVSTKDKINNLDAQITTLELVKSTYPKGDRNLKYFIKKINELKNKKRGFETKFTFSRKNFVFENFNTYVLFYIFIIIVNFVFSSTHWIILAGRMDFFIFWLSGLGIIYFIAGCVISIIGWRYGWLSAIILHASWNAIQILTAVFILGVV